MGDDEDDPFFGLDIVLEAEPSGPVPPRIDPVDDGGGLIGGGALRPAGSTGGSVSQVEAQIEAQVAAQVEAEEQARAKLHADEAEAYHQKMLEQLEAAKRAQEQQ